MEKQLGFIFLCFHGSSLRLDNDPSASRRRGKNRSLTRRKNTEGGLTGEVYIGTFGTFIRH